MIYSEMLKGPIAGLSCFQRIVYQFETLLIDVVVVVAVAAAVAVAVAAAAAVVVVVEIGRHLLANPLAPLSTRRIAYAL